jgi:hypothetical protein
VALRRRRRRCRLPLPLPLGSWRSRLEGRLRQRARPGPTEPRRAARAVEQPLRARPRVPRPRVPPRAKAPAARPPAAAPAPVGRARWAGPCPLGTPRPQAAAPQQRVERRQAGACTHPSGLGYGRGKEKKSACAQSAQSPGQCQSPSRRTGGLWHSSDRRAAAARCLQRLTKFHFPIRMAETSRGYGANQGVRGDGMTRAAELWLVDQEV